ncbi:MAG: hypothetical protein ACREDR_24685, partial [Blastocatellia bacterium]
TQDYPTMEVGFTYTYVRVNSTGTRTIPDPRPVVSPLITGTPQPTITFTIPSFSANGGTGSFAYNFTDRLAGVIELGGFHNGNISDFHIDNTWFTFMMGPRVSLIKRSHTVVPSLHLLLGGTHRSASVFLPPVTVAGEQLGGERLSTSEFGFSMALGGALDIRVTKLIAIRPIELDYYLTRLGSTALGGFEDFNNHNLRYQAGVIFRIGGK